MSGGPMSAEVKSLPCPYYQDKSTTIYHGDCREILPSLPFGIVDLVITDPPYSISVAESFNRGPNGTRRLDFFAGDTDWASMTAMVVDVLMLMGPTLKPHASIYTWCGHRQFGKIVDLFEGLGMKTRFLVWSKLVPVPQTPSAFWASGAELCVFAYPNGARRGDIQGNKPRSNVFVADGFRNGNPGKTPHPTQKPVQIINPLINISSRPGDLILDCFMGSGSTLRAAKDLGRRSIGIEREERYCDIAAKRMRQEVLLR